MRPHTVAEACRRARDGQPWDKAIGEFLQSFYCEASPGVRCSMLREEPPPLGDARYDALVGGIAEYLFKRWAPEMPPPWIGNRDRYLEEPWFPHAGDDPALREYLTFASPAEFKSRNIMTDEVPLRRAAAAKMRGAE